MQITFDTDSFGDRKRRGDHFLANVLHYLKRFGCVASDRPLPEVEKTACRTPSGTLRYCMLFAGRGVSAGTEEIFLKNPELGVRYLKMVGRSEFLDPQVQKKFRRKFRSNPKVAYQWASHFRIRLTEDEEECFRKDMTAARDYAKGVIGGRFPDRIHEMLILASFGDIKEWEKEALAEYVRFSEQTGKPRAMRSRVVRRKP